MEIVFYNSKAEKFFVSLDVPLRARADRTLHLLGQYGNRLGLPHSRALGGRLFELRVVGVVHIRFMYTFHFDKVWIIHGFIKKTGSVAASDIKYARKQIAALLQEYNG